jgi:hypothetical protein
MVKVEHTYCQSQKSSMNYKLSYNCGIAILL